LRKPLKNQSGSVAGSIHRPTETGPHSFICRLSTSHRPHTSISNCPSPPLRCFSVQVRPLPLSFPHSSIFPPSTSRSREKAKHSIDFPSPLSYSLLIHITEKMDLNGNKESSFPPAFKRKGENKKDLFHVIHKVPAGDSPYVRAKHLQVHF
jgi:hypothetical protein